jgi:hypothetical protein
MATIQPLRTGWHMAKIIEFYIPNNFRKKATRWIPLEQYGKVIPFVFTTPHSEPVSPSVPLPMASAGAISEMAAATVARRNEVIEMPVRRCRAVHVACLSHKRRSLY